MVKTSKTSKPTSCELQEQMDIALQNRYDLLNALFGIWCRGFRGFVFFVCLVSPTIAFYMQVTQNDCRELASVDSLWCVTWIDTALTTLLQSGRYRGYHYLKKKKKLDVSRSKNVTTYVNL